MKKIILLLLTTIVLLSGCGFQPGTQKKAAELHDFNRAFPEYVEESWCQIPEDGSYMYLDTNPFDLDKTHDSEAYGAIMQANEKLGFTAALGNKMGQTSALDGRQTESNDLALVSWKYHPNNGLEVTYEWK